MRLGTADDPATPEASAATIEIMGPTNVKVENLADGWVQTYEAGGQRWVYARRTIRGEVYTCDTAVPTTGRLSTAVAFCKALR